MLLVGAVVFAAALVLCLRGSGFPYYYHYDTPSKIEQVRSSTRNFHHPFLMLNATEVVARVGGAVEDKQQVARIGRTLSAIYMALAIALMVLLAGRLAGVPGAMVAAPLLLLDPDLIEHGHYFKENAPLLLGVAAWLLACSEYLRRPSRRGIWWLAAAAAFAASAKAVGLLFLPASLLAVASRRPEDDTRGRAIGVTLSVWLGVAILLNLHPAWLRNAGELIVQQRRELDAVILGRHAGASIPNLYFGWLAAKSFWPVWPLLCGLLLFPWREDLSGRRAMFPLLAFPFLFALLLSLQRLAYPHYFLPVRITFLALCAVGAGLALRFALERTRPVKALVIAALTIVLSVATFWQARGLVRMYAGMREYTRDVLVEWVKSELPPQAVIAQDSLVRLPAPDLLGFEPQERRIPQRLISATWLSDLGSLEQVREAGATHVAVAGFWYEQHREQAASGEGARRFAGPASFAHQLEREGRLLKRVPGRWPHYLNPELLLFEIAPRSYGAPGLRERRSGRGR